MRRHPAPAGRDPGAVGLIGLGEIGQVHAAAVRRSRSARLVALNAVTAGREPPVTGAAALDTMRLLDRIYRTAVVLRDENSPGRPGRP